MAKVKLYITAYLQLVRSLQSANYAISPVICQPLLENVLWYVSGEK